MFSYLDDPEGNRVGAFASIGYEAPSLRRQELNQEIARWNRSSAARKPNATPYDDATISNLAGDIRAQEWNNHAAKSYANRQAEIMDDEITPRQAVIRQLMQRYQRNQPSLSRYGDELSINGERVTGSLSADAQGKGMSAEDYTDSLYKQAKQKAAADYSARLRGEIPAGTAHSKLFNDPQFMQMPMEDQKELFNQVEGYGLDEALMADKLGGGISVADLRRQAAIPAKAKEAGEWFKNFEASAGFNPMLLLDDSAYDPKTQTLLVKGKPQFIKDELNPDNSQWVDGPVSKQFVPSWMREQAKRQAAYMSGQSDWNDAKPQSPEEREAERLAQLEKDRKNWMTGFQGPAMPPQKFLDDPRRAAAARDAVRALQLNRVMDNAASAAKAQADRYYRRQDDAELMKEFAPKAPFVMPSIRLGY